MSFELAATSLSHLVLHQLSRKTLGVCALTTGKVCVLAVATCQTPIWWGNVDLTRLERLIQFLSLLALVFFLHVTTSLFDFSKNCNCFFGSSQSCGHGGHVMGEPPAAEIETRGSSQGSDQGMGEIGPKQVQVVAFFFVGMPIAGDHEIYGDLSDVPPQRLREDMGLAVCKSF